MAKAAKQLDFETEAFQKASKLNAEIKTVWGKREAQGGMRELVGVFYDPVIMFSSPWMDTLPEWIKPEITQQRLLHIIRHRGNFNSPEAQQATDIEAMAYMYPASLEFPLSHDWSQIYLYLTTKCLKESGRKVPDDVAVNELRPDEQRELSRLKSWIYRKRVDERKRRIREEKLQPVQVDEKPDTQRSLF
ncbi:MAG: hypothetical protein ACYSOO_06470 [Planctomycetota bacterium]|jgi:hypothetical protein